mmetsp:Transcript_4682/g.9333  ORF Transcript_4682/g.9333 Transcript_4682/m.9333 type:complete len:106 (-) Transcript_4682:13-330(-)
MHLLFPLRHSNPFQASTFHSFSSIHLPLLLKHAPEWRQGGSAPDAKTPFPSMPSLFRPSLCLASLFSGDGGLREGKGLSIRQNQTKCICFCTEENQTHTIFVERR